jgi:hypothetical protein
VEPYFASSHPEVDASIQDPDHALYHGPLPGKEGKVEAIFIIGYFKRDGTFVRSDYRAKLVR